MTSSTHGLTQIYRIILIFSIFLSIIAISIVISIGAQEMPPPPPHPKQEATGSQDSAKSIPLESNYLNQSHQLASLNVQVVNDIYTNEDRKIYYCQEGKYYYIRNRLSLAGPDLDKVALVKYILPQSFPNPEQLSEDAARTLKLGFSPGADLTALPQ